MANNNINGIEEAGNGDLWLATDDGISILNEKENAWRHVLKGTVVVTLCRAQSGNIWAGTYGDGVYLLNPKGQQLQHLTQQEEALTTNYIFSIRQDQDGDIWVGGHNGWLMLLDKTGQHKQTYDIKWIHSIEIVAENQVGVATVNGFYLVNKATNSIKSHASFPEFQHQNASAYIISMLFNEDQTVWLGTEGGGLNLYHLKTGETRTFTTQDGLPSDDVYSLQKDARGRLWVSTGKGLALMENHQVSNLNYLGDIDKKEAINTQAWILHFTNPSEAWSNQRRSGYPRLKSPAEYGFEQFLTGGSEIPVRLGYPVLESSYNKKSYEEALARMGGFNSWNTTLWWDVAK